MNEIQVGGGGPVSSGCYWAKGANGETIVKGRKNDIIPLPVPLPGVDAGCLGRGCV